MTDHIFVRGGGGNVIIKMDLPLHEDIEQQLIKGYLRRVNEDGSPYAEPVDQGPEQPPAASALKPEWIGYVVRVHGVDPDTAEAMTKADLVEKYGPKAE